MKNEDEFFEKMKARDSELILKMVKCVISAHKRKREKINIFDIVFKDTTSMTFAMEKSEYKKFLENCMQDMINIEEYEICSEIKKIITRKPRQSKNKTATE
jgi:hypothetical protein